MKSYTRYSKDFKEQALAKVYSRRNDQSIQDVADDLHICLQTLKTWMKKAKLDSPHGLQSTSKRPQDWKPEERLAALQLTYGFTDEALNAWCRGQGLFVNERITDFQNKDSESKIFLFVGNGVFGDASESKEKQVEKGLSYYFGKRHKQRKLLEQIQDLQAKR